ncbi:MAG TPA: hypothetical protein VIF62_28135 [Labilithrix sp.]|jgi:hypothetical protein
MLRSSVVAAIVCCASLFAGDARASGDVFGDCVGCGGGGSGWSSGSSTGKNGFTGLSLPLFGGALVSTIGSWVYVFPAAAGAPIREFPFAWHAFGATVGVLALGLGAALVVDGATVHDGVGGIVVGGLAAGMGGVTLAIAVPPLLARPIEPVHAAIMTNGSRIRLGVPAPEWMRDVGGRSAAVLPLFSGTL